MRKVRSAEDVIEEFAQVIAEHYVATRTQSEEDTPPADADEFVSHVESGLRTKLLERISKLQTTKRVQQTPTIDYESAGTSGKSARPTAATDKASKNKQSKSDLAATLDTPNSLDLESTAEIKAEIATDPEAATIESKATDARESKGSDFSYDQPTLATDAEAPAEMKNKAAKGRIQAAIAPAGYEILSTLGKGGMGVVYKARHIPLNRLVAVKMILAGAHATKDQLTRFQREAESAARLSHPNIVSIYEVGQFQDLPYFSLEFVDGESVSELLRESTLTARRAAELLIPVARAVHYSHEMGVLHRDLKPQNILLTAEGTPKVADFGLAKRLDADDEDDKTRAGVILGTPGYLAPEQAQNTDRVGPHTDVFALGCILYYMMTGRPPFTAPTPLETVQQTLRDEPLAPSRLQHGLDKDLETICLKALEKEIPRRYQTAQQFAEELQRFLDGEPIVARPITRPQRLWKWCKRNPGVATLSTVACTLLLCLLMGGLVSSIVINHQKNAEKVARHEAEENAKLADDQAELALDTTRMVLYQTKDYFEGKPELAPLRESMMQTILDRVEQLHDERYSNDVSETFTASADSQLGQIYLDAGAFEKARDRLLTAAKKLRELKAQGNLYLADISEMNLTLALGDTFRKLGELDEAEARYLTLERQRSDYFARNPDIDSFAAAQSMAEAYGRLAVLYRDLGNPEKSLAFSLQSVAARRKAYERDPNNLRALRELAGVLSLLSITYERAGDFGKMLAASRESLDLQKRLAEKQADFPTMANIAKEQKVVGRQCLVLKNDSQAEATLESAAESYDQIMNVTPENQSIRAQAADVYYLLGVAKKRLSKDSSASFRRAENLQQEIIATSDNVNTQGMLLKILARNGKIQEANRIANELAGSPDKIMNCGYLAVAYALLSDHYQPGDKRQEQSVNDAIDWTRKLIRLGYHDFESMRSTDLDFEPLQDQEAFLRMLAEEEVNSKPSQSPQGP